MKRKFYGRVTIPAQELLLEAGAKFDRLRDTIDIIADVKAFRGTRIDIMHSGDSGLRCAEEPRFPGTRTTEVL